jgi:cellulose synthase/poly-beta-1,6-N-acetylglucosamine synthase-like glycosyltransferase
VPHPTLIVAIVSLLIWLYLLIARGLFWKLRPFDDETKTVPLPTWPYVVALIPARNEAATIGESVAALIKQDYPGEFSVVVIDDHSEDNTSQIAQRAANGPDSGSRLYVLSAPSLPAGWTGKLWALNQGVRHSPLSAKVPSPGERRILRCAEDPAVTTNVPTTEGPTYFWFTDADIVHAPDTLRRLVAHAEQNNLDLTSLMVLLRAHTFPERALIPAFLFFFLKLYPQRWTADSTARTAGAAGGCILLRRDALDRIGGLSAIRGEVIDDCALARAVKHHAGKIWMGLTRKSLSQRAYVTFAEIRDMIARTAFTQLRYSTVLLLGTLFGLFLTYVAPVALLFMHNRDTRVLALVTWLLMSCLFLPTVRFYRLSPVWAPLLPLAAVFYAYATWLSAKRYWLHRGGQWKGRSQAPYQA